MSVRGRPAPGREPPQLAGGLGFGCPVAGVGGAGVGGAGVGGAGVGGLGGLFGLVGMWHCSFVVWWFGIIVLKYILYFRVWSICG